MKNKLIIIILIALAIVFLLFFITKPNNNKGIISKVCIGEKCFNVQIADTEAEREKGLMFVSSMPENEGMLFVFDREGIYEFWMKNTFIPLDMIWFDENMQIVYIENNAMPCGDNCKTINPNISSKYVVEINGNLSNLYNFAIGQKVKFIYS